MKEKKKCIEIDSNKKLYKIKTDKEEEEKKAP